LTRENTFPGYPRPDGGAGVRNYVAVVSSTICANEVARRIAAVADGARAVLHQEGCGQYGDRYYRDVAHVLGNLAANPNVAAVLVVSLGCENVATDELFARAGGFGKPAELLTVQEFGVLESIRRGTEICRDLCAAAARIQREPRPISDLTLGLECGASDPTSTLSSNPSLGAAADLLVEHGGRVILSETPEWIGAEHILAAQAHTEEVAGEIENLVRERIAEIGHFDLGVARVTRGNESAGLTTIEEKSLGAIKKGGGTPVREVVAYGHRPREKGLVLMDSPGFDVESMSGMLAGGAQIMAFTTGLGSPTGTPLAPVIKICGNEKMCRVIHDCVDVNTAAVLTGERTIARMGRAIFDFLLRVAGGELTCSEKLGFEEFSLYRNELGLVGWEAQRA